MPSRSFFLPNFFHCAETTSKCKRFVSYLFPALAQRILKDHWRVNSCSSLQRNNDQCDQCKKTKKDSAETFEHFQSLEKVAEIFIKPLEDGMKNDCQQLTKNIDRLAY